MFLSLDEALDVEPMIGASRNAHADALYSISPPLHY